MSGIQPVVDAGQVRATLKAFTRPGEIFDIQCRGAVLMGHWRTKPSVLTGWFDSIEAAEAQLARIRLHKGGAVQLMAHTINPDLIHRRRNEFDGGDSTAAEHVLRRRWLMVDLDPKRVKGINSTQGELDLAHARALEVDAYLGEQGFPQPYICCSGNGIHIVYACDLANTPRVTELVGELLNDIFERFDDEHVEVDRQVKDAGRRLKLYGTITCKGAHSEERPRRASRIISAPDLGIVETLGRDTLETFLAPRLAQKQAKRKASFYRPVEGSGDAFDLERDIVGHPEVSSNILREKRGGGDFDATWVLKTCPACQDKRVGIASFGRMVSGALYASCKRDSCVLDWGWMRDTYAPRAYPSASKHPALRGVGNGPRREERSKPQVADVPEDSSTEGLDRLAEERRASRWDEKPTQLQVAERAIRTLDPNRAGVVCAEGALWRYVEDRGCWQLLDDEAFKRTVLRWDREQCGEKHRFEASVQMCRDALNIAYTLTGRPEFFERARPGFVLDGAFVHADTDAGEVYVLNPSNEHRARAAIDCALDEKATGKLLYQYLSTVHGPTEIRDDMPEDDRRRAEDARAKIQLMGEVIFSALCGLGPHFNKAFLAYGPQGTGKSQWLAILMHLIPESVQSHIQPHSIGHEYYAAELAGARLNVVTECDEGSVLREAGFKAVVSGEPITARKIRGNPFMFRPQALHLFAGNALPPAPRATDALWVRWLPISFTHRFRATGDEVKDIGRKIATQETEAVIAWAMRCGRELLRRGRYTVPPSTEQVFHEWRVASDSVAAWVESCEGPSIGNTESVSHWPKTSDCYRKYKEWCQDGGFKAVNSRTFGKRLLALDPVEVDGVKVGVECKKSMGTRRYNLKFSEFSY